MTRDELEVEYERARAYRIIYEQVGRNGEATAWRRTDRDWALDRRRRFREEERRTAARLRDAGGRTFRVL